MTSTATPDPKYWTIAYRPAGGRFFRRLDVALTWDQARAATNKLGEYLDATGRGDTELWFTPNAAADAAGWSIEEDRDNIMIDTGRRVPLRDVTLAQLRKDNLTDVPTELRVISAEVSSVVTPADQGDKTPSSTAFDVDETLVPAGASEVQGGNSTQHAYAYGYLGSAVMRHLAGHTTAAELRAILAGTARGLVAAGAAGGSVHEWAGQR